MHREESQESLEINKLNELERSVSLCTLCVLEVEGDCKDGSPHCVSSFDEVVASNFFAQSSTKNYLSNYLDRTKVDDQNGERTFPNDNQLSKGDVIITPPIFDDNEEISQSLSNVLASLDASYVRSWLNNEPKASQNIENVLQITKHDHSPISEELGIASEFSKSIVKQIVDGANNLVVEQENIEVTSRICKKATERLSCNETKNEDFNLITENNYKIWEKNASAEPVRCYVSDIQDDEIPRKKPKIVTEDILHSPYKIKLPDWPTVSRKCNKGVRLPMDCPTASKKIKLHYENNIELKNETIKDEKSRTNDKNEDHWKRKRLELQETNEKVKETMDENSNIRKNGKFVTPMYLRDPPRYPHLHPRPVRTRSRQPPTLKRLQEKIGQSCKMMIEGAEDLRNLSLFIDELRDGFSQTLIKDPKRKSKESRQKFVSTFTQTSPPNGLPKNLSVSELPSSDIEISRPIALKSLENEPKSSHCQDLIVDCLGPPPRNVVTQVNCEINRESHIHPSTCPEVVFDNNYNRLRPRKWPNNEYNNRKTARKNRTRHLPHNFPPLPVCKENEKTTKHE